MTSCGVSRDVRISTGVLTLLSRSARTTLSPSRLGKFTSKITASYGASFAHDSPSSPSCATSTTCPCSLRPRRKTSHNRTSSSTTSRRMIGDVGPVQQRTRSMGTLDGGTTNRTVYEHREMPHLPPIHGVPFAVHVQYDVGIGEQLLDTA